MKHFILLLLSMIFYSSCQQDSINVKEDTTFKGVLNGRNWEGGIYTAYINTEDDLVIGASKKSNQKNIDSENIVIFIPDFNGDGEYFFKEEGAMYREMCFEDMMCALGLTEKHAPFNKVTIENYNANTGYLEGSVTFEVNGIKGQAPTTWKLESGNFKTTIQ